MENDEGYPWIDNIRTGMNACSLEVLRNFDNDIYEATKYEFMNAHPLIIGCYELNEYSSDGNSRKGEMRLYMVEVNEKMNEYHDKGRNESISVSFCNKHHMISFSNDEKEQKKDSPVHCCKMEAGVLDGKWFQRCPIYVYNDSQSKTNQLKNRCYPTRQHLYATACASGNILIHALKFKHNEDATKPASACFYMEPLILTYPTRTLPSKPICLSLDLDESTIDIQSGTGCAKIVSSYSDGSLAIHTVHFSSEKKPTIQENNRWKAHSLFRGKAPAEVWTCCWAQSKNNLKDRPGPCNLLLSGGDDGILKGWDSYTGRPIFQIGEEEHGAGVTAVSWHPTISTVFASGSYDEGVRIWDVQEMTDSGFSDSLKFCATNHKPRSQPRKIASIDSCGGGIWRLKWHPTDPSKLLVAVMHGGCRVLHIPALKEPRKERNNDDTTLTFGDNEKINFFQSLFTAHDSMAYGADWLVTKNEPSSQSMTGYDIAASCSFYDQNAFLWQTNF